MAAAPKVVIDCSAPDKTNVDAVGEAAIAGLIRAALDGKITAEERDAKISEVVAYVTDVGALPDRVHLVALTPEEANQQTEDADDAVKGRRRALRAERDTRLRAADWTQLPDAVLPAGTTVEQWRTYRQQLRDWPAAVDDPLSPPAWPAPPA